MLAVASAGGPSMPSDQVVAADGAKEQLDRRRFADERLVAVFATRRGRGTAFPRAKYPRGAGPDHRAHFEQSLHEGEEMRTEGEYGKVATGLDRIECEYLMSLMGMRRTNGGFVLADVRNALMVC